MSGWGFVKALFSLCLQLVLGALVIAFISTTSGETGLIVALALTWIPILVWAAWQAGKEDDR